MTGKELRNEYWKKAVPVIRGNVKDAYGKSAFPNNRDAFDGCQKESLQLTCIARIRNPIQISVGIYIKNTDVYKNKAVFEFLEARKEEIRSILPVKDVEIGSAEGKGRQGEGERKQYNILVTAKKNILDENNWVDCCNFHSQVAKALYDYAFIEKHSEIQALLGN